MESKEFSTIFIKCILCCRTDDSNVSFLDIDNIKMSNSNKTVKSVLMHLTKCIKDDYNFEFCSSVCSSCFERLDNYDQTMVQLLCLQKELGSMLEVSIKAFKEQKINMECIQNNVDCFNCEYITEEIGSVKDEEQGLCSLSTDDNTEDAISNHLSEDSEMLSLQCDKCGISFKTRKELHTHLKDHSSVKCSICGAMSKDEEYLELHMNIHEGKTENECRYCPKRYTRRSHVIRHMHIHWDKKKFQCEKCGLRFSQANVLYNHKMNHEAEDDPIICTICHQMFKTKRTFKHHMITHQENRPKYPCKICDKVFTQKYTLTAHLKAHAEGNVGCSNSKKNKSLKKNPKEFCCIICDKVMGTQDALDSHMAKEHDVISAPAFISAFS